MKLVKVSILGIVGGLGYAFISFYLLTPVLRHNLIALAFWGIQGLIFSLLYTFLMNRTFTKKYISSKKTYQLSIDITIGAICGLLSGALILMISTYHLLINYGILTREFRSNISSVLIHYMFGYILLGTSIGFIVGYIKKSRQIGKLYR